MSRVTYLVICGAECADSEGGARGTPKPKSRVFSILLILGSGLGKSSPVNLTGNRQKRKAKRRREKSYKMDVDKMLYNDTFSSLTVKFTMVHRSYAKSPISLKPSAEDLCGVEDLVFALG
ncbi:hypothetical protein UY3_04073 [Chelonia mydas]|uniref:Uncharacterized protein n=1 Tax=Chelonia mydas TaxID=8469 RepID=M7BNF3_CHEMY|nr:hypothetical protein UY3_04073 [Chelonia mydas]